LPFGLPGHPALNLLNTLLHQQTAANANAVTLGTLSQVLAGIQSGQAAANATATPTPPPPAAGK
jgi:hypothetical protein